MVADALAPCVARTSATMIYCIDYVKYVNPGLIRGRISTIYGMSVWRNDIKCNYMFIFSLKNFARKGLNIPHTCKLFSQFFNFILELFIFRLKFQGECFPFVTEGANVLHVILDFTHLRGLLTPHLLDGA